MPVSDADLSAPPQQVVKAEGQGPQQPVCVIDTAELFKGASEVRVRHRGDEYRLRITRQGKLILTK